MIVPQILKIVLKLDQLIHQFQFNIKFYELGDSDIKRYKWLTQLLQLSWRRSCTFERILCKRDINIHRYLNKRKYNQGCICVKKNIYNNDLKNGFPLFRIHCTAFYYFPSIKARHTADRDLLKMVPVEILLNFGNYFCTLQLGFWKFLSGIVFLYY